MGIETINKIGAMADQAVIMEGMVKSGAAKGLMDAAVAGPMALGKGLAKLAEEMALL